MPDPLTSASELDDEEDLLQFVVAAVGALVPGALYLALPNSLSLGPRWLLLIVEVVLVAPPLVARFIFRRPLPYPVARALALALLVVVTVALVGSIILLVANLPETPTAGARLLRSAALLWGINILVFALWYWEVDGNGPLRRLESPTYRLDFLFPQQLRGDTWRPGFVDYVFLAFGFATALSPADTMPLTHRAKLLMMSEAVISLLIIVLLVARSVNVI